MVFRMTVRAQKLSWFDVRCCTTAVYAAGFAVAGYLAMTFVLSAVAAAGMVVRGMPAESILPALLADPYLPWFCAAAGVLMAALAGYITARPGAPGRSLVPTALAAGTAVAAHVATMALVGTALAPVVALAFVVLIAPAVLLGGYLALPSRLAR